MQQETWSTRVYMVQVQIIHPSIHKNEDDERAARSPCDEAKADLIYSRAATGESVHRCDNLVAIVS